jgi:CRISPR/Cas system-associated protein endoribonuclease Cas2
MFEKPYISADVKALLGGSIQTLKVTDKSFASHSIILCPLLYGECLYGNDLRTSSL